MSGIGRSSVSMASRARLRLRTRVSEHPALYLPLARRRYPGPSPQVVGPDTELVIDGYTRSATTFAVYALQLAQPRPVRLAHHLHAPAQLIEAARRGIPTLVLIREPRGAVLSQAVREPWVPIAGALSAYARFYARLLPYRNSFVLGEFSEVTHDFGAVVRRLNDRFATSFAELPCTDPHRARCMELTALRGTLSPALLGFESGTVSREELEAALPALRAQAHGESLSTWVPSAQRDAAKNALAEEWSRPSLARLRDRAEQTYHAFIAAVAA
jgi:hypothetical protein